MQLHLYNMYPVGHFDTMPTPALEQELSPEMLTCVRKKVSEASAHVPFFPYL